MSDEPKDPTMELAPVKRGELVSYGPDELATLETRIAHAEKMANALDTMRALAIKRTVSGDWKKFGDTYYLEGDGATRIAPVIGLHMENVRTARELVDGVYRVTVTADFRSDIFRTSFPNVQRTRTSEDDFLTQRGAVDADLGDLENAAYKGCLARGAALVAGLAGLSAEDLLQRFGIKVDASAVDFRKGAETGARGDAKDHATEGDRILVKLCEGDREAVATMLFAMTNSPGKFAGVKTAKEVRPGAWSWLLPKLVKMEQEYDAAQAAGTDHEPTKPSTSKK